MKHTITVLFMFVTGCVVGYTSGHIPYNLHQLSLYILYALMFQVGISAGCSGGIQQIIRNFSPQLLLIPLATVIGTLLMSVLVSLIIMQWGWAECMAVGGGLGYYSLSSILITQLKADTLGEQLAVELGTIALMANIIRELFALTFAPLLHRMFGPFACINAAGVCSVDVCLPAITRYGGQEMIPIALMHGMLLDMTVPVLIPLLCEW